MKEHRVFCSLLFLLLFFHFFALLLYFCFYCQFVLSALLLLSFFLILILVFPVFVSNQSRFLHNRNSNAGEILVCTTQKKTKFFRFCVFHGFSQPLLTNKVFHIFLTLSLSLCGPLSFSQCLSVYLFCSLLFDVWRGIAVCFVSFSKSVSCSRFFVSFFPEFILRIAAWDAISVSTPRNLLCEQPAMCSIWSVSRRFI